MKVKNAIAYFEDAVRESEEIIANCSPALQAELAKQKEHFVVALAALREQEQRQWISVKERLPDLELEEILSEDMDLFPCLAVVRNERARGGRYVTKVWYNGEIFMDFDCVDVTCNVTHWMPLPEPPKEGADHE